MKSPEKMKNKMKKRLSKLGLPAPNDTMLTPIHSGGNKNSPLMSSILSPPDSPTIIQGIHEFVKLGAGLDNDGTETQLHDVPFGQQSRTPPSEMYMHKGSHNINADIMSAL